MGKKKDNNHNKLGGRYGGPDGVAGTPDDARRRESKYYMIRDRAMVGRDRTYLTAESLFNAALEYFDAVDSNPMKETKVFGTGIKVDIDLQIPYTTSGFCLHAGISQVTFKAYKTLHEKEDATEEEKHMSKVAQQIDSIIYTQKIEGATAGKFNHQIVALQLGLAAKVKNETVNHDSSKMTADEIKKFNAEIEGDY